MLPLLVAGAGTLASLYMQKKAADKQQKYTEDVTAQQKKDAKRQALASAIGANVQHLPKVIEPPDISNEQLWAGLGSLAGNLASQYMARTPKVSAPVSTGANLPPMAYYPNQAVG